MKREKWSLQIRKVTIAALGTALVFMLCPVTAFAQNSEEARSEFSNAELKNLFEKTNSYSSCEFVLHDYTKNGDTYLKVRDTYRERYEKLVGEDSVRILSQQTQVAPNVVYDERPLEKIEDTSQKPWCDLLYLDAQNIGKGSAFMVSDKIAITAAHCVYEKGGFATALNVQSGLSNGKTSNNNNIAAVKTVISRSWVDNAGQGTQDSDHDHEHDFAIMIFEEDVPGAASNQQFSYDSISVWDSLWMSINCAGYLKDYDQDAGIYAYKNKEDGVISLIDLYPGGNCFSASLSWTYGMSGGPIYRIKDGAYIVIGIISYQDELAINYACRITERLQVLIAWTEESGGSVSSSSSGSSGSGGGSAPYGNISSPVVVNTRFLTTYGVRDGSAGPDFLGISNTNIDLLAGGADLYSPADATETSTKQKAPLALWGGTVNQNPNPYYTNLLYHAITGTQSGQYEATTWRANSSDGSWGDSDGTLSYTPSGQSTIAGLEYAPDLIFGANKYVNWNLKKNGSNSGSLIYEEISKKSKYEGYDPVFVNYDTTNLWTQLYSMNQLAKAADGLTR